MLLKSSVIEKQAECMVRDQVVSINDLDVIEFQFYSANLAEGIRKDRILKWLFPRFVIICICDFRKFIQILFSNATRIGPV